MNRDSFITALFVKERPRLIKLAYRLTGNEQVADDMVQETFYLALLRYDVLAAHPRPGGWLTVTLYNLILNERRRLNHSECSLDELGPQPAAEQSPPLEESLPRQLSPADRQLLIWRFEEQLNHREIADRLGISEGACRTRVCRAVDKCRQFWKAGGP